MSEVDRSKIFSEIKSERYYQLGRWGNVHDDDHTPNDWVAIITRNAGHAVFFPTDLPRFRRVMVRVAAVAVAAIEWCDRRDDKE